MSTLPETSIVLDVKCNLSASVFPVAKATASNTVKENMKTALPRKCAHLKEKNPNYRFYVYHTLYSTLYGKSMVKNPPDNVLTSGKESA